MPLVWDIGQEQGAPAANAGASSPEAPVAQVRLWPNRSLPRRGFVWFIGATAALISMPLLPVLGTPVLWGLLPFLVGAVALLWVALERSYRDGRLTERLTLWPDRMRLERTGTRGPAQEWEANPFWVSVHMREEGGPVENYVTLRGAGREVEIGAFLSPAERADLFEDIRRTLARMPPR